MKYAVALWGIIILIACGEEQTTNDAKVQVQLDSINQQLLALREQLKSNDNINDTNALKDSSEIPDVPLPPPPPSPLADDRKKKILHHHLLLASLKQRYITTPDPKRNRSKYHLGLMASVPLRYMIYSEKFPISSLIEI